MTSVCCTAGLLGCARGPARPAHGVRRRAGTLAGGADRTIGRRHDCLPHERGTLARGGPPRCCGQRPGMRKGAARSWWTSGMLGPSPYPASVRPSLQWCTPTDVAVFLGAWRKEHRGRWRKGEDCPVAPSTLCDVVTRLGRHLQGAWALRALGARTGRAASPPSIRWCSRC